MTYSPSYRRILHKMGYYDYQQGLIFRHLNQENGWDNHLERCRSYILKAVDIIRPEKVTILGSGWLLELPLAELAERTSKICLIDVIHPPEVKEQVKKLKNVELREDDVSGGLISYLWRHTRNRTFLNKLHSLQEIKIPEFRLTDPGMIISLNIVTQLESLPLKLLSKKSKVTDEEYFSFRKKIQDNHLKLLRKFRSVLITDTYEVTTTRDGKSTSEATLIADIPEGTHKEEWQWDFDLRGSDYVTRRSVFKVMAIIL